MSGRQAKKYRKELRKVAEIKADNEFEKLITDLNKLVFKLTRKKNILIVVNVLLIGLCVWGWIV